jgi:hypothetical protein
MSGDARRGGLRPAIRCSANRLPEALALLSQHGAALLKLFHFRKWGL